MPEPSNPTTEADTIRRLNELAASHATSEQHELAHQRPVAVHLQVASGCNLDCYMCIEHLRPPETRRGRGLKFLSREVFDKLCNQVFPYSSRLHLGFGGEPTLAPDFPYFIEQGFQKGQQIDLTTNGTGLGKPGMASLLAKCVSSIRISVDAATPETYERIRSGSRWTHLMQGIGKLNAERLQTPVDERAELTLVFVLMRSNLQELPAFVELAKELCADGVRGQHIIPTTEEGQAETLFDEPGRYNEVRALAAERAEALGIELDLPAPYPVSNPEPARPAQEECLPAPDKPLDAPSSEFQPIPCRLPFEQIFVSYEGVVTPCCNPHANARMHVGDLRTQDFDAIWNNRGYRGIRRSLAKGPCHPICEGCTIGRGSSAIEPRDPQWLLSTPHLMDWASDIGDSDTKGPTALMDAMKSTGMLERMTAIEQERDALRTHAEALLHDRPQHLGHIDNLEAERQHLLAHIKNLESESGVHRVTRGIRQWIQRTLGSASKATHESDDNGR